MENNLRMPASYNVLNEDEMTYTEGGANIVGTVLGAAAFVLVAGNLIWALDVTRSWIRSNRPTDQSILGSVAQAAAKGVQTTANYAKQSIWNTLVVAFSTINLLVFAPVTAVAWLTV